MPALYRLLLLFITLILGFSQQTWAKPIVHASTHTGLVFVHGTSDHRLDAEGGYWSNAMISSVAKGLENPENVLVVHCDFAKATAF